MALFAAVKEFCKRSRIDKVIAMVRVVPFWFTVYIKIRWFLTELQWKISWLLFMAYTVYTIRYWLLGYARLILAVNNKFELTVFFKSHCVTLRQWPITLHAVDIRPTPNQYLRSVLPSVKIISNPLECGQMPNVMAALPNIGGGLCSTPQSLADAHY